jgi:two-component system response regulator RegA
MNAMQKQCAFQSDELHTKSVLIVEDDKRLMHCLTLAMEARGFEVMNAESVFNAIVQINLRAPEYAVVDLRLGDGCGLDVISALKERQPDVHAIILTGYGNIATAVRAVKLGAVDYLTKPADMDDIISIPFAPKGVRTEAPSRPMSAAQVRWKHILQVRILRIQRVGNFAASQDASPHAAADTVAKQDFQVWWSTRLRDPPSRLTKDSPSDPEEAATMVGCLSVAGVAPPCAVSA